MYKRTNSQLKHIQHKQVRNRIVTELRKAKQMFFRRMRAADWYFITVKQHMKAYIIWRQKSFCSSLIIVLDLTSFLSCLV